MDPFRTKYRELSDGEKQLVADIKEIAGDLHSLFSAAQDYGKGERSLAIAKTKLEETVMWAVKGITG